ncbi:MAG: hypothetical protein H0V44_07480 [Planctomycetes bacterium]|nr:hypothetical protein [Planctomycetota bacterium]
MARTRTRTDRTSHKRSTARSTPHPGDAATIDVSRFVARWRPLEPVIAQIQRQTGMTLAQSSDAPSHLDRLLSDRLDQLAIDVSAYALRCANDPFERLVLLDLLHRRPSAWFADPARFVDLERRVVPQVAERFSRTAKPVMRVWCAATGSGEEVYSIAASMQRSLPDRERWDATVLATDLSVSSLQEAQTGRYDQESVAHMDTSLRTLTLAPARPGSSRVSVRQELRRTVHFAWLDLNGDWDFIGPFDAVFCRGLLDRFTPERRSHALGRIAGVMRTGSTLYLGGGEDYPEMADHFAKRGDPGIYLR